MANEPETYVKRKRRKRLALTLFLVGLTGCTALGIIAFIGQVSGQFTVNMGEGKNNLEMSDDPGFETPSTYLRADGIDQSQTIDADMISDSVDSSTVSGSHNKSYGTDSSGSAYGGYLAYTFYVRNPVGSFSSVDYSVVISIDDYVQPSNQTCSLMDIVRVRLYENAGASPEDITTHNSTVYGAAATVPYTKVVDGVETVVDADPVGIWTKTTEGYDPAAKNPINNTYCTNFISTSTVAESVHLDLQIGHYVRYTVVIWLEGADPDTEGKTQPKNASITFSMHLNVLSETEPSSSSDSSSSEA